MTNSLSCSRAGEHVTTQETPQKRVTKKRDTETPTKKKRVGERWLNPYLSRLK